MNDPKLRTLVVALFALYGVLQVQEVLAATRGDSLSAGDNGAVLVSASTATPVPATCKKSTNTFAIFNNGPNTIWCGFKSTVSNTTGFPVGSQSSLNIDITCDVGVARFWCKADTADQVSPSDTRYLQVK